MITVTPPEKIGFSKDRIVWKFYDDGAGTTAPGVAATVLKITDPIEAGTQLVLRWQNADLRLRAADHPNSLGGEFPSGDGSESYAELLAQWFEKNYYISEDFTVVQASYEGFPAIYFYGRKGGTGYAIAPTAFTGGEVVSYMPGSDGTQTVNNSVFVEVKVMADNYFDYVTAYKGNIPLEENRTAKLDVGKILEPYLKQELPSFGLPEARRCLDSCREYYIRYAHAGGEYFSIGQVETSEKHYVMLGGSSKAGAQLSSLALLKGTTAAEDKFLTVHDRIRYVRVDEPQYLSFVNLRTTRTYIAARVSITYEDGTTTSTNTDVVNNVLPYQKVRFAVGFSQLNLAALPKRVKEYSVRLQDSTGADISESVRYIIDYSHREYLRYLAHFNSMGGVEVLKTFGKASNEYKVTKEVARKSLPDVYGTKDAEFVGWGAAFQEVLELSSGYIPKRHIGYFVDFFLSDQQYRIFQNNAYPVVSEVDEVHIGTDGENLSALVFPVRYARENDAISVSDLDRLSDLTGWVPAGVQVAGEVTIQPPGGVGEWEGVIDPYPILGSDNPVASGGVYAVLQNYQPLITTGTALQYFRGDFSLGSLATDVPSFEQDPTVPAFAKTLTSLSYLFGQLKTVDGISSGLDADLWRGQEPSEITVGYASRLENEVTISLTGAVTGSVGFDGAGNVTINTTVAHTHAWEDITGKPTKAIDAGFTDVVLRGGNENYMNLTIGTKDDFDVRFIRNGVGGVTIARTISNVPFLRVGDSVIGVALKRESLEFSYVGGGAFLSLIPEDYGKNFMISGPHKLTLLGDEIRIFGYGTPYLKINSVENIVASVPITISHSTSAPLIINSTYLVENLNADLLDGQHGDYYRSRTNHTGTQSASTISDLANAILTQVITGYAVGSNAALAAGDTIIQALGKIQAQLNVKANIPSAGTQNMLPKFGSGGMSFVNSQIFDNGTNVGIGITSPFAKLDVGGNIRARNEYTAINARVATASADITFGTIANGTEFSIVYLTGTYLQFRTSVSGTDTQTMTITTARNVGINTHAPSERLHVVGNIRVTQQLISNQATGTAPFVVASTTVVTNLNADLLDGYHAAAFPRKDEDAIITGDYTFPGFLLTSGAVIGSANAGSTINIGTDINTTVVNIGRVGATVNISGTVNSTTTTDLEVVNKTILLNDGGAAGSGFEAGILIEENNLVTGSILVNTARSGWEFKVPAYTYKATFLFSALTANRSYVLPNAAGTIALQEWVTAQLAGYTATGHSHTASNITDWDSTFLASLGGATSDALPEGTTNLYFSNAKVLNATISSFVTGAAQPLGADDTLIEALGKLQAQINEKTVVYAGEQNKLVKYGSGGTVLANSVIFDDGSNVGIGITSPFAKLDVGGNIRARNEYTAITTRLFTASADITFGTVANGTDFSIVYLSDTYLQFRARNGDEMVSVMTVAANKNIGINISSPSEKLHVAGNIRATQQIISNQATGAPPFVVSSTTMVPNLNVEKWQGMVPENATVYKATRLENPRTITIGGAVTGSGTFDGSENIIIEVEPTFAVNPTITLSGDVTGTGAGTIAVALIDRVTAGQYTKVTVNAKGLVTAGGTLTESDIPTLSATKISNFAASVRSATLTGFSAAGSPSAITASDTILQALGKIQAQLNNFSSGTAYYVPRADSTGKFVDSIIQDTGSRVIIGSGTETGSWMLYVEGNIITKGMLASTAPDGTQPLSIISKTMVSNLNAHYLGGYEAQYFMDASNLQWGFLHPSLLSPTGVVPGRYTAVMVDVKGRVMEGYQLEWADILPILPPELTHDSRHPRFHRFNRVYLLQGQPISPPLVFDFATKIASHHIANDLTVKFIARNFKSQGIQVNNSGLVLTLEGTPEFTFDADEIAIVVEDSTGNQTVVPIDVSVISDGASVPACPVGYPTIVAISEASTIGLRAEINYSTISTLAWRVKQGGSVVANGTINTAAIPAPTNKPWISFPSPLAPGAYTLEVEGMSCTSSVSSMSFSITVAPSDYTIAFKYYDLTTGSPVFVADISNGAILPWFAAYNIQMVITGRHSRASILAVYPGGQSGWGPENIAAGGAAVDSSSPWLFGPNGNSEGRQAGTMSIQGKVFLATSEVLADATVSFTLQTSVPEPTTTGVVFSKYVSSGGSSGLVRVIADITNNQAIELPLPDKKWGAEFDIPAGVNYSQGVLYHDVLIGGAWIPLRRGIASSADPFAEKYNLGGIVSSSSTIVYYADSLSQLYNNATGLPYSVQQPGTHRIRLSLTHEGEVKAQRVAVFTLYTNTPPTSLMSNPGVESVTVMGKTYEFINDGAAGFEIQPDGKVKIIAPVTKQSFDGARTCNRFLNGDNYSETLPSADVAALFGSGLDLPKGVIHNFWIHYYAASSMDEVYANPWKFCDESNPESAGWSAPLHNITIFIHE